MRLRSGAEISDYHIKKRKINKQKREKNIVKQIDDLECFEYFEMLPEEIIIYISIYFRDDPQRLGRFRQTTKVYVQFCQVTFNKLHWHFEVYQNFEQQKFVKTISLLKEKQQEPISTRINAIVDDEGGTDDEAKKIISKLEVALKHEGIVDRYWSRQHPDLNFAMRAILYDWLQEVAVELKISREVFQLAIYISDKYLSIHTNVKRSELQLVGSCCFVLASAVDEDAFNNVSMDDFVYLCDNAYNKNQVKLMFKKMIKTFFDDHNEVKHTTKKNDVNVGIFVPTPYLFLRLCEKELLKQLHKQNASDEFCKRAKKEVKLIFLNLQEKIDLILICCPPHCSSFILVKHILYLYFENTVESIALSEDVKLEILTFANSDECQLFIKQIGFHIKTNMLKQIQRILKDGPEESFHYDNRELEDLSGTEAGHANAINFCKDKAKKEEKLCMKEESAIKLLFHNDQNSCITAVTSQVFKTKLQ